MKILQVTQRFNPSISGSQYHVYRISKELVDRGHEVSVVTTTSMHNKDIRGFSTSRHFSLTSDTTDLPKAEIIDGISVYRFQPIFQFWMHMVNPLMFLHLLKTVNQYDVVHGHVYMGAEASLAAKACLLGGIPFVFTAHDLVSPYQGRINALKKIYDLTDGFVTLSIAKKLIALTNENRNQYISLGASDKKIKIVSNGIDYEKYNNPRIYDRFQKKAFDERRVALFVARLVRYKGAQYIIMAIPDIIKDYPNTKFVFIGEDQGYKEKLIKLALSLNVFDKCTFTGKVSDRTLLDYYSKADVFLLPSIGEGFGLVVLEAISNGIPVILANEGGLKHILSDIGGYSIDMTGDIPDQISNHIKKIFLGSNSEIDFERNKKLLKSKYSWEQAVEKLESVYLEVLK